MKHPYTADCTCVRCERERERRASQSTKDARSIPVGYTWDSKAHTIRKIRKVRRSSRTPIVGSAEWAETRGDDIQSYDLPGDDFDA